MKRLKGQFFGSIEVLEDLLEPIREKRKYYENHMDEVDKILKDENVLDDVPHMNKSRKEIISTVLKENYSLICNGINICN